ncbi:MoaD/ThiS family protein [Halomarina ordinaria]|uniref:MoaD/ThiS family protein n=1 Tax=Halomarina ordinaria TaxID=3033939 RepID=A0ABD5U3K4_9EURY|nr:MoaD/ThiS family protein [Halomarina sp. PSRA2]
METTDLRERSDDRGATTVNVRCTGHVRTALGTPRFEYTFEGSDLRAFLEALFDDHPELRELLIAETEADATAHGWARHEGPLPGTWRKNPEGEQTRAYARVLVNGRFNEHLDGLDTDLEEGDRVSLLFPFIYCC